MRVSEGILGYESIRVFRVYMQHTCTCMRLEHVSCLPREYKPNPQRVLKITCCCFQPACCICTFSAEMQEYHSMTGHLPFSHSFQTHRIFFYCAALKKKLVQKKIPNPLHFFLPAIMSIILLTSTKIHQNILLATIVTSVQCVGG